MASVMGVGAVVGGLISAARPRPRARALCLAAIGWGIAILAAAAAPSLPLELAALVFVGYGSITFNSLAKTTLQLAAAPTMRGRVMALWALAWLGSTPIGGPIVGFVGQDVGARWSPGRRRPAHPAVRRSWPCPRWPASTGGPALAGWIHATRPSSSASADQMAPASAAAYPLGTAAPLAHRPARRLTRTVLTGTP